MPIAFKQAADSVGYLCRECGHLKNPQKNRPHLITIMTGLKQGPGGLQSIFDNGLVCRFCFLKLKLTRKLASIAVTFPELLQPQKPPATMQPAAAVPKDRLGKDGKPRVGTVSSAT